jgi:hypothetical protein
MKCRDLKADGSPCTLEASVGPYCHIHDPNGAFQAKQAVGRALCAGCGKIFRPYRSNWIYCDDCYPQGHPRKRLCDACGVPTEPDMGVIYGGLFLCEACMGRIAND